MAEYRQSFCRFRGLNILTDGRKPTDAESIHNRWRFVCKLRQKVVENQYKMVYYSTYCVLVNRRKRARHLLYILGTLKTLDESEIINWRLYFDLELNRQKSLSFRRNFRPTGYVRNTLCPIFKKLSFFPKMSAILNFCQNAKTQKCFYLLNRSK